MRGMVATGLTLALLYGCGGTSTTGAAAASAPPALAPVPGMTTSATPSQAPTITAAQVQAALLTPTDLPAAWRHATASPSSNSSTCAGLQALLAAPAVSARRTFARSRSGPYVQELLAVQPSPDVATAALGQLPTGLAACGKNQPVQYSPTKAPAVPGAAAVQAYTISGGNASAKVSGEIIVARAGRVIVAVTTVGISVNGASVAAPDTADLPQVTAAALAKARPLQS